MSGTTRRWWRRSGTWRLEGEWISTEVTLASTVCSEATSETIWYVLFLLLLGLRSLVPAGQELLLSLAAILIARVVTIQALREVIKLVGALVLHNLQSTGETRMTYPTYPSRTPERCEHDRDTPWDARSSSCIPWTRCSAQSNSFRSRWRQRTDPQL